MSLFKEPRPKKLFLTVNNLRKKMISDISYDLTLKIAKGEDYTGEVCVRDALTYAKDQSGCRMLQSQIDKGDKEFVARIFNNVKSEFVDLIIDSFGNYLIQKLSEKCSVD